MTTPSTPASGQDIGRLIDALTLAYNRLSRRTDALHGPRGLTTGPRALLVALEDGPQTVSRLAERRAVSRQFAHRLMKALLDGGWVCARDNPRHKGSPLMELTDKGAAELQMVRTLEAPLLSALARIAPAPDLRTAARVLETLCAALAVTV